VKPPALDKRARSQPWWRRVDREQSRILADIRAEIADQGVAIVAERVRLRGMELPVHYTVGLTRHEDHPEVIVVDECCECADQLLGAVADVVRQGVRLSSGWGIRIDGVDHVLVEVMNPNVLHMAQLVYAHPGQHVPALELVPAA
jgi:stage III sporulation protein SpoIIIAA